MTQKLLEVKEISKTFPGVKALQKVNFDLEKGECHALLGENGAGKSTLIKILSGVYEPDEGEIFVDGQKVLIPDTSVAFKLGISPIHQELNLNPLLSVAENIFLGRQPIGALGLLDYRQMYSETERILASLGTILDPKAKLETLSTAQQQMVAIARAISFEAKVIIMDEPTSSITDREVNLLFETIARLKKSGIGIIYISHRLEELPKIADRATVLRDGELVGTVKVAETDTAKLISMMIGRTMSEFFHKEKVSIGKPVLEVKNLVKKGVLEDISFTLRSGEILGISGLVGAGRTELARMIFGADPFDSGEILIDGNPVSLQSTSDAVKAGIAMAPEDRKLQGLVLGMSIRKNITMANLFRMNRFGFIKMKEEFKIAADLVDKFSIRTPSVDREVIYLSGGNQQRVVIAKWLATNPKVLILDEPTRGIDVNAKAEIYGLMCDLVRNGVGILMISSELPEILAMSDRVLVMHEGRISGCFEHADATPEAIMSCATGEVH
ncbi:MAG: sugar ABC transporter ATP-binding protein [Bacillota bacterium]